MLNIATVRREMLCNLCGYACLDADADLEDRIRWGLKGAFYASRCGVPFL